MRALLLFSLIFFHTFARADPPLPGEFKLPKTMTDLEKLQLLLAIKKEVPDLLTNGTQYGFDPVEVLNDQARLLKLLEDNPEYVKAMAQRSPHLNIQIRDLATRTVKHSEADPAQVEAWRSELRKTLEKFPKPEEEIAKSIRMLKNENADSVLANLIKNLEGSLKGDAFRQPGAEAKIAFLKNTPGVPEQIKNSLRHVEELLAAEKNLHSLSELAIAMQPEPGKWLSTKDALAYLSRLSESNLNAFRDHDHFVLPRVDALNARLHKIEANMALRTSVVAKVEQNAKSRLTPVEKNETVANRELFLTEHRPSAAIFRGCEAKDCSTKYSFAAPNNPDELVFRISDAQGETKGYLEATRVKVDGKNALYVSSINGPKLSSSDVDLLMESLYKIKATLGVEDLITPNKGQIDSLMNFDAITTRMHSYTAGKKAVKLEFQHPKLRSFIEKFESDYLKLDYDNMAENKKGYIYTPNADFSARLEVKATAIKMDPLKLAKDIDRRGLFLFAQEMAQSDFTEFSESVLRTLGLSQADQQTFKDILKNNTRLSAEKHENVVRAAVLKHTGSADTPNWLITEGRMKSPDAFSAQEIKKTASLINAVIPLKPPYLGEAITRLYLNDPSYEAIVKSSNREMDLVNNAWLNSVINANDPELDLLWAKALEKQTASKIGLVHAMQKIESITRGTDFFPRALRASGFSTKNYENFKLLLNNPNKLSAVEHEAAVKSALFKLTGTNADPASFCLEGRLNAPDAFTPQEIKKTGEMVELAIQNEPPLLSPYFDKAVIKLYQNDPSYGPVVQKWLEKTIQERKPIYSLIEAVMKANNHQLDSLVAPTLEKNFNLLIFSNNFEEALDFMVHFKDEAMQARVLHLTLSKKNAELSSKVAAYMNKMKNYDLKKVLLAEIMEIADDGDGIHNDAVDAILWLKTEEEKTWLLEKIVRHCPYYASEKALDAVPTLKNEASKIKVLEAALETDFIYADRMEKAIDILTKLEDSPEKKRLLQKALAKKNLSPDTKDALKKSAISCESLFGKF